MQKYLVQQRDSDGNISLSLNVPTQIIQMFGFRDCTGCEFEVFDASEFGNVVKMEHTIGNRPNYHVFVRTDNGKTEFEGESPIH